MCAGLHPCFPLAHLGRHFCCCCCDLSPLVMRLATGRASGRYDSQPSPFSLCSCLPGPCHFRNVFVVANVLACRVYLQIFGIALGTLPSYLPFLLSALFGFSLAPHCGYCGSLRHSFALAQGLCWLLLSGSARRSYERGRAVRDRCAMWLHFGVTTWHDGSFSPSCHGAVLPRKKRVTHACLYA